MAKPATKRAINAPTNAPAGQRPKPRTGKSLLEALKASGLVGMWRDRDETRDPRGFAAELRRRAQSRG